MAPVAKLGVAIVGVATPDVLPSFCEGVGGSKKPVGLYGTKWLFPCDNNDNSDKFRVIFGVVGTWGIEFSRCTVGKNNPDESIRGKPWARVVNGSDNPRNDNLCIYNICITITYKYI